jgi:hypothetical protein
MIGRQNDNLRRRPELSMKTAAWPTQFDRMVRALKKVEEGNPDHTAETDDFFSFFQHCWHLKDWIKNDDSLPSGVRKSIVQEAEQTESLQFCADLANGSKHLKLTNARKGASLFHIDAIQAVSSSGEIQSRVENIYAVSSKSGPPPPENAIEFAEMAVADWIRLHQKYGLNPV